jgi:transcription elongation factor GreB
MSKAFTNEETPPAVEIGRVFAPLPPATPNLITAGGAQRFAREVESLQVELAGLNVDDPRRAILEASLAALAQRVAGLVIKKRLGTQSGEVAFGSTVQVDGNGKRQQFTIVGVDESDASQGRISWLSPIGAALLGLRPGESVTISRPAGDLEITVLDFANQGDHSGDER